MKNQDDTECLAVSPGSQLTEEACQSLSFTNFGYYDIWTGWGDNYVRPVTRNVRRFSLETHKEIPLTEEELE